MDFFQTVDLHFQGHQQSIAVYVIPHKEGIALIESGPGSTFNNLKAGLENLKYRLEQITDVFVTHIHLDHAGAVGALAKYGATIHVHPVGAPHLINPEKLLASATRIYGEHMDRLWGKMLPVPENQIHILEDGDIVNLEPLSVLAMDTPGHATHHHAYLVREVCFSGDVGGIRIPGTAQIRLPMPPPELNLEDWRRSVKKLRAAGPKRIAPTHFGVYEAADKHLLDLERLIDEIDLWMEEVMPGDPSVEEIDQLFQAWTEERAQKAGLSPEIINRFEAANPTWMSAAGIQRYWRKYRAVVEE
jgi:glyoxylase-like metal-dependent hydrolase (beta-lactamase superfamily II)